MQHIFNRCIFSKVSKYTNGEKYKNLDDITILNTHHYSLICCIGLQKPNIIHFIENVKTIIIWAKTHQMLWKYIPPYLPKNTPINIVDYLIFNENIKYALQLMLMGLHCTPDVIDNIPEPYHKFEKIKILISLGIKCTNKVILNIIKQHYLDCYERIKMIRWIYNNQNIYLTSETLNEACKTRSIELIRYLLKNNAPISLDTYNVCIEEIKQNIFSQHNNNNMLKIMKTIIENNKELLHYSINILIECKINCIFELLMEYIDKTDKNTIILVINTVIKTGHMFGIKYIHKTNLNISDNNIIETELINNMIELSIESNHKEMFNYLITNLNHTYDVNNNFKTAIEQHDINKIHIISGYMSYLSMKKGTKRKR